MRTVRHSWALPLKHQTCTARSSLSATSSERWHTPLGTEHGQSYSIPYPCLTGLSASYFAVRPHRNRWRTRSHQLGRRLRPTLRQSHTLPLRTPAPAASSFCSRQPTHTALRSASTTGHRRYACSWPLAVLVNSLSNDSVSQSVVSVASNYGNVTFAKNGPVCHVSANISSKDPFPVNKWVGICDAPSWVAVRSYWLTARSGNGNDVGIWTIDSGKLMVYPHEQDLTKIIIDGLLLMR